MKKLLDNPLAVLAASIVAVCSLAELWVIRMYLPLVAPEGIVAMAKITGSLLSSTCTDSLFQPRAG